MQTRLLKRIDEVFRIIRILTPKSLENRAALRTAIATLTAVLIAFTFHLDNPYWSGMTVVILANVYTGSIIDKAILRIVGTVIGAWVGYFLAGLVVNSFFLYLLANFLLISLAIYYYSFSTYAYAYLLGALAAFIVLSQLALTPENAFYVAIWRPVEIGLGVIVSAAAAWCVFPNKIKDSLLKETDLLFDQLNHLLEQLSSVLIADELSLEVVAEENTQFKKKIKQSTEMIGFMRLELGIKRERVDQFRALLAQFLNLGRKITYFTAYYEKGDLAPIAKPVIDFIAAAQNDLKLIKKEFITAGASTETLQTEAKLADLYQGLSSQKAGLGELSGPDLGQISAAKSYLGVEPLLQQISTMITSLSNILSKSYKPVKQKTQLISSQQQLRNDPDIIFSSIKTALSALLALSFWLVSNWPGGINGIVSSVIISIRKNLFEMKNISLYRLLGCFIGGGLALLPLNFYSMNLYDFIVLMFFAVWGFSYFSFKNITYSYIGLQANVALIISLAQEGGPPIDLEGGLERLAGIVIGIVASFLVANVLWRTDFFSLLSRHLRKLYRSLVYNINALLLGRQKNVSLYDLTSLLWLCRSLIETFPEGYFKGKKQERLEQAKKNFVQMTLIQATISHIYGSVDLASAHNTAAKYNIELKELEKGVVTLYQTNEPAVRESIKQKMDESLAGIDLSSFYAATPGPELSNCISYLNALNQLRQMPLNL